MFHIYKSYCIIIFIRRFLFRNIYNNNLNFLRLLLLFELIVISGGKEESFGEHKIDNVPSKQQLFIGFYYF